MHVGTHGSCVRSNNHVFAFPFTLNGRTVRASLHASKQATRLHVNLFTRQTALERTHEPCVPTCPQSRQLVHKATCLFVNRIGADARTVRPYIASPIILPAKMIDFSDRPLADRRLSLRFRHAIMGESRDNLSHDRRFYSCPKPAYRVPSRFFQSSFV